MYLIKIATLMLVLFCVYIFVNLFENPNHYNIGTFLEVPTKKDWVTIIIILLVSASFLNMLKHYNILFQFIKKFRELYNSLKQGNISRSSNKKMIGLK